MAIDKTLNLEPPEIGQLDFRNISDYVGCLQRRTHFN